MYTYEMKLKTRNFIYVNNVGVFEDDANKQIN